MVKITEVLESARDSGLIAPEDLLAVLETTPERVKLVDASYPADPALPGIGKAVTFDIDDIADPENAMAHMLPTAELFAEKVSALGISNDDFVICYDQSGFIMAASRAWWMFRVFGHDNVAVLDGGLITWIQKNYPVAGKPGNPSPAVFKAHFRPGLVVGYDQVKEISAARSATLLDARPPERFTSHIPGSKNIPALTVMQQDRRIMPKDSFSTILKGLNIRADSPLVATCGSGVTACAVALALFREGRRDIPVYDGSWTEWSQKMR